jgi:hypothetical protein
MSSSGDKQVLSRQRPGLMKESHDGRLKNVERISEREWVEFPAHHVLTHVFVPRLIFLLPRQDVREMGLESAGITFL